MFQLQMTLSKIWLLVAKREKTDYLICLHKTRQDKQKLDLKFGMKIASSTKILKFPDFSRNLDKMLKFLDFSLIFWSNIKFPDFSRSSKLSSNPEFYSSESEYSKSSVDWEYDIVSPSASAYLKHFVRWAQANGHATIWCCLDISH